MITIAIADDIKTVRQTLIDKINLSKDFKIINEFYNGKELFHALLQGLKPDIILMDIEMPEMNGIEATEKIINRFPDQKILMCTVFDDEQNLFNAICAGAKGYLLKDEKPDKIHHALFETMEGGSAMSAAMANKALQLIKKTQISTAHTHKTDFDLTEREIQILGQIAKGLSYEQVAENTGISYGTVRKHLENIYRKLNVHNKLEAVNKAKKGGII